MDQCDLDITADLAQIELKSDERANLQSAIEQMVDYFAGMAAVDVSGLEPTTQILLSANRTRSDVYAATIAPDSLIAAAMESEDEFFVVPNVL